MKSSSYASQSTLFKQWCQVFYFGNPFRLSLGGLKVFEQVLNECGPMALSFRIVIPQKNP